MALADDFQRIVDSLPPDWTQLELDLRIDDEDRYIETATLLTQINAMPYSRHDWHWRLRVATSSGTRPPPRRCTARSRCSTRSGSPASWWRARRARAASRSPQMWGRPESVREEFRRRRAPVAPLARVALLCPDLLFGSKVEGALRAARARTSTASTPRSGCGWPPASTTC